MTEAEEIEAIYSAGRENQNNGKSFTDGFLFIQKVLSDKKEVLLPDGKTVVSLESYERIKHIIYGDNIEYYKRVIEDGNATSEDIENYIECRVYVNDYDCRFRCREYFRRSEWLRNRIAWLDKQTEEKVKKGEVARWEYERKQECERELQDLSFLIIGEFAKSHEELKNDPIIAQYMQANPEYAERQKGV